MEHLVYCDNAGKKGEKELDKILAGTKTMVVRGAAGRKIPHTAIENFVKLVEGKATLIKKALNAARLDIRVNDEKISLPWFNDTPDTETVQAFMQLASCMLAKANSQQRVTLRDKPVENEKYAFRCFLLRLGFIGDEYKAARKTLLKNLEGNSAFKNFEPPHSIY
jgi:hypothetical protein